MHTCLNSGEGGKEAVFELTVSGQVEWEEGKILVFDDSFEHEVWWRWPWGTQPTAPAPEPGRLERVVLILDVFHPELPEGGRARIRAQFSTGEPAEVRCWGVHAKNNIVDCRIA